MAWFMMLFLFEAETYWLDAEAVSRFQRRLLVVLRFACYAFLAHTVYAYVFSYFELIQAPVMPAVSSVCDLSTEDFSFVRNLAYTTIDAGNCATLSSATSVFQIAGDRVVTDPAGFGELKLLYAVDLEDAVIWISVVLVIELVVLLQEKGVSGGQSINICNLAKKGLYGVLICNALFWLYKGHWVYCWDQFLWIGGFAAIEMNLSDWRDELRSEAAST